MKILLTSLLAIFCLIKDCKEPSTVSPNQDTSVEQNASVKMFVCSRGCYKYLIDINGVLFSPDSLPAQFKQDKKLISVTGKISDQKVTVYKPAPNDVPVPAFEVNVFQIKTISERKE